MTTLIGYNVSAATFATATNTSPVLGGGKGFSVGSRLSTHDGKQYVFAQAGADIAAYNVVSIPSDTNIAVAFQTSVAAASETVAVPQFAVSSGEYAWFQIYGACKVKALGSCAKSVLLYSTATAGSLDDATASNYQVTGVQLLSTNPSATASAMSAFISYPKVLIRPGVA